MPLLTPVKKRSLSFGTIVANFFVSPLMRHKIEVQASYELDTSNSKNPELAQSLGSDYTPSPSSAAQTKLHWSDFRKYTFVLLKGAVLKSLPFDGFDPSTNSYTTADGEFVRSYDSNKLPLSLFLTSLFGMPNRPNDAKVDGKPVLDLKQAFKDWWGGWTMLYTTRPSIIVNASSHRDTLETEVDAFTSSAGPAIMTEAPAPTKAASKPTTIRDWNLNAKTILQIAPGLIIKFLIILPFKLVTWPFKIALNVVKLFTEVLPLFLSNLSAAAIGELAYQMSDMWNKPLSRPRRDGVPRAKDITRSRKFAYIAPRVVAIFFLGLVHYSTRIIFLVLRALTSPQQSARQAFYAGRGLKITSTLKDSDNVQVVWKRSSNVLGFILGSVSALVSLAVSAVGWAIFLPLTLGAISSFIPQLPVLISNIATLPFIASSLATINGVLGPIVVLISNTLGAAFAPVISTLASFVPGLVMNAQIIAVGTTLGILLAPLASIANRIADVFSNVWAAWNPPAPNAMPNKISPKDEPTLINAINREVGINLEGLNCSSKRAKYVELEELPSSTARSLTDRDAHETATASSAANVKHGGSSSTSSHRPRHDHTDVAPGGTLDKGHPTLAYGGIDDDAF